MPERLTTPVAALVDRESVRTDVDRALFAAASTLRAELGPVGPDAGALADATDALLSGGKRLRAAFCYWSWRAHGAPPDDSARPAVIRVGAALELFQASALFHDDVMDASTLRRGRPTAHLAFAARHTASGWLGDADRFGENAAILLGDLSLIASHRELADAVTDLPDPIRRNAHGIFGAMQTEVTAGQYLDILGQALPWGEDPDEDEARARAIIRSKSARYSVEQPIALGAVLAGAPSAAVDAARRFGLPLGEAFQLRDDLLGVFGDPATTGKPAADDLREGKRTVLVNRALRVASPGQRATLLTHLGDAGLDDAAVADLRAILVETGAAAAVEAMIGRLAEQSFAALRAADLTEPGATMLAELGDAAVRRVA